MQQTFKNRPKRYVTGGKVCVTRRYPIYCCHRNLVSQDLLVSVTRETMILDCKRVELTRPLSTLEDYQEKIIPCLVKLFASSDRNARYKLLCQIETFVEHLSNKVANDQVFPQVIKVRAIKKHSFLIPSYYSQNS